MMADRSTRRRLSYSVDETDEDVCSLCVAHHDHMSKVDTWHAQEAQDIATRYGIAKEDLVCRPCRDDIRRIANNPEHVPRWKKGEKSIVCCVLGCANGCFVQSKLNVAETTKLPSLSLSFDGDTIRDGSSILVLVLKSA